MIKSLEDFKSLIEFTFIAGIVVCFTTVIVCTASHFMFKKEEVKPPTLYEYWTDDKTV